MRMRQAGFDEIPKHIYTERAARRAIDTGKL